MSNVVALHFHIGERRPEAGIAWTRVNFKAKPGHAICFYAQKEPGNKISRENVPEAVRLLLAAGHQNLVIESAVR